MTKEKWNELLALVNSLGNVSRACKELGVSRSLYYKLQKQFSIEVGGKHKVNRRHPQATPENLKKQILDLAIQYPDWGCDKISYYLEILRIRASSTTVQKILRKNGMARKSERRMHGNNFRLEN
jgi:transposase